MQSENPNPKFVVVDRQVSERHATIQGFYRDRPMRITMNEKKDSQGEHRWYGKLEIDGSVVWESRPQFGCRSKEELLREVQRQANMWDR